MFSKLRSTRNEHPLIFNYWLAEGVALSGLLLLAVPPRVSALGGVMHPTQQELSLDGWTTCRGWVAEKVRN